MSRQDPSLEPMEDSAKDNPDLPASSRWSHPAIIPGTGIVVAMLTWFGFTWTMLNGTKGDLNALETELKGNITEVEARLKADITAAEARLNTIITGAETRLTGNLSRVEGRLDRIMEILLDDGGGSVQVEAQQQEDASR